MKLKYLFAYSILAAVLLISQPAHAARLCLEVEETDAGLIDFTDELGYQESLGLTRREYAKDKLVGWVLNTIAMHRAAARKNEALEQIENEERQKAAMELAPRVEVTNDE